MDNLSGKQQGERLKGNGAQSVWCSITKRVRTIRQQAGEGWDVQITCPTDLHRIVSQSAGSRARLMRRSRVVQRQPRVEPRE
jgi:hypothetical protein